MSHHSRRAFSLIEILVTLAVFIIILAFILPNFFGGSHQIDLTDTTNQIVTALRQAQSQSAEGYNGSPSGVYFSNATDTAPFYAVFNGTSYASGTVQSVDRLPSTIGFMSSKLPLGASETVTFSTLSGAAPLTSIGIYDISLPSLFSIVRITGAGEIDATGKQYLYVVDSGNERIEVFDTSDGAYVTQFTSADPLDLDAVNVAANYVYISDAGANAISIMQPIAGGYQTVSTFGGLGSGPGEFDNYPAEGAIDADGNVYVVDSGDDRVEEFSSDGSYITQFGSVGTTNGQFETPTNIAIDPSGNIYVTDDNDNRVEKFNASGVYVSQLGGCSSGPCSAGSGNGQFSSPGGIAIDSNGNVYVSDTNNNRVEKFNASGSFVSTFGWGVSDGGSQFEICTAPSTCQAGIAGSGSGQFSGNGNIAVDANGNIYVDDRSQNRVEEFSSNDSYIGQFGCSSGSCSGGSGNGQLSTPEGITVY